MAIDAYAGERSRVEAFADPDVGIVAEGMRVGDLLPLYPGPMEITPGESEQVLQTSGMRFNSNVVVKAIPSNYGRIVQKGASLFIY